MIYILALDSSTWYHSYGDTSRKGKLKNTHEGRTSTKVEASSQDVFITSRTIRYTIYNSSRKTKKQEEEPYIKAPTRRENQRRTYIKLQVIKQVHLEKVT